MTSVDQRIVRAPTRADRVPLGIFCMLTATMLWALAHLLVNGAIVNVVLFGAFLVWAVVDRISMGYRVQRPLPSAPPSKWNDAIAVVGGLGIYAAFLLGAHRWLFGVSPLG